MNAIIPDTLNGAIILSVIDFFLSFIIIAGIGVILAFLPFLNRIAEKLGAGESDHSKHRAHSKKKSHAHGSHAHAAPAAMPMVGDVANGHIAAISTAVYSVVGPHQIVHVERAGDKN